MAKQLDPKAFEIKQEIEAAVKAILEKHARTDFTEWSFSPPAKQGTSSTTLSDTKSLQNGTYLVVDVKIKSSLF